MRWKIFLFIILGLAMIFAAALIYGTNRWQSATKEMHARLEAARLATEPKKYSTDDLIDLPVPVQRYFRATLRDGQAMISAVSVEHTGTFNMSETGENWKRFTSTQRVITLRPGFDWEARIKIMPGVAVHVHDAYIAGQGILQAKLLGLVWLMNLRGTPELAQGELMRFFAEAVWYPTALLPGQGMRWQAEDESSAWATMNDGDNALTMLFRFDENGLIQSVRSEGRWRSVADAEILTPWEGRYTNYEVRDGMRIPLEGEVAWMLLEGPKPYWRGRITKIIYEFAQ